MCLYQGDTNYKELIMKPEINQKQSFMKSLQNHPDRYFWAMSYALLFVNAIQRLLSLHAWGWVLFFLLNIIYAFLDSAELKKDKREAPDDWTRFILPVYVWQRVRRTQFKKLSLFIWILILVASMFFQVMRNINHIENIACHKVTDIIAKQYGVDKYDYIGGNRFDHKSRPGSPPAIGRGSIISSEYNKLKCRSVSIYDFLGNQRYRATAILKNGKQFDITIKRRNNKIKVRVNGLSQ